MEKTANSPQECFNKNNVLICWNPGEFAIKMMIDGYNVATSYAKFKEQYERPETITIENGKSGRKKKNQAPDGKKIAGLVVLCELSWGLSSDMGEKSSSYSTMSGIDLVKVLRQSMDIPILFVSFLNRKQQLQLSTKNVIISTPVLGHFYEQLPSTPDYWIEKLNTFPTNRSANFQDRLSKPELGDIISHFCKSEGMLGELKHDLRKYFDSTDSDRSNKFEVVFRRIEDIVGSSSKSSLERLKKLKHVSDEDYNEKIEKISVAIDSFILDFKPDENTKVSTDNSIEVVLLDDEIYTDKRFDELLQLMHNNNLVVHTFSDPNEAIKKVELDVENQIQIIFSDYRIWNKIRDPWLLEQMQGYTFLMRCSDLSRTYTYVVLSALDRKFLMKQFDIRAETLYKNGVLANESSKLNFIWNLLYWGEINKNSLATKFSNNPNFITAYNWYRSRSGRLSIDAEITNKIANTISAFRNRVLNGTVNCISKRGKLNCSQCEIYKNLPKNSTDKFRKLTDYTSNYSRRLWDPQKKIDIENLKNKFAGRRLFFFYVLSLKKFNCLLAEDIADNLVDLGYINVNSDYKFTCSLVPDKSLWITKNNVENNITPEDETFLKSYGLNKY